MEGGSKVRGRRRTFGVEESGKARLVVIRNVSGMKLFVTGLVSGRRYEFGIGQEVPVDEYDVADLLSKYSPKGCCGGRGSSPKFIKVEE